MTGSAAGDGMDGWGDKEGEEDGGGMIQTNPSAHLRRNIYPFSISISLSDFSAVVLADFLSGLCDLRPLPS